MLSRALSAAALAALALLLNRIGGGAFLVALAALNLVAVGELRALAAASGFLMSRVTLPVSGTLLILVVAAEGAFPPHLLAFGFLLLSAGTIARGVVEGSAERLAWSTLALVWLSLPLALLALVRYGPNGERAALLTFAAVWAYDSGAYLGGCAFGRHRLSPSLSPKKSVEGVLFGVAAAMAACHALNLYLPVVPLQRAALFGAVLGLCAQCGDLVESCVKRRAGVKDSGDLIPGHGGLLDRIDGLVFAIPPAYALLRAFGS